MVKATERARSLVILAIHGIVSRAKWRSNDIMTFVCPEFNRFRVISLCP